VKENFFYHLVLPPLEPKTPPDLLFLTVLSTSNTIFHLIEKHFTDYILRNVGYVAYSSS